MNVLVSYTTLQTKVLFEVTRKHNQFELMVLQPVQHKCSKSYESLKSITERLHLSEQDSRLFIRAFLSDESSFQDLLDRMQLSESDKNLFLTEHENSMIAFSLFVKPLTATVSSKDVACNCC